MTEPKKNGESAPVIAPKPEWKFAEPGDVVNIPGLFDVKESHLSNPDVIKAITMHEAHTGHQLFGKVFVRK